MPYRFRSDLRGSGLVAAVLALSPLVSVAEDAPLSNVANPGIYKVLQENDEFRVVLATWKPGQRDELHSHPANATYTLTPCHARVWGPDGKVQGRADRAAGDALLQPHIAAHSFENIGSSECQILIVERK